MAKRIIARAVVAALTAAIALALFAGSAVAQQYYMDTLVMGTVTGAPGGTVTVSSGFTLCTTIAGGTIAADGTYQVVVNCDAGTGRLFVNGKSVATGRIERTQAGVFSGDEGADVGADEGTPVTEAYKVPFKFTGKIAGVTIELKEMKKTDMDDATEARKAAALKKGLSD